MGRAPCCDKASVKKGHWSPEEDKQLKEYIEKNGMGGNWITLPHKAGLNRCGKSCRLRWLNYLKPNIKHGCFSDEEDRIIASLYAVIGSRWSVIASHLPGRTDNDIKNYWNTKLKKKFAGMIRPQPKRMKRVRRDDPSSSDSSNSLLYLLSSLANGNATGLGDTAQHLPAAPPQDASSCVGLENYFFGGGGGGGGDAALVELDLEEYRDRLIPNADACYGSAAGWSWEDGEYGGAALREAAARAAMLDPEENMNSAVRSWRGCSYDRIAYASSTALW